MSPQRSWLSTKTPLLVAIIMVSVFVTTSGIAENRFTDATTAVVTLTAKEQLHDLVIRNIDIDKVVDLDVNVYLLPSEYDALTAAGYNVRWIPNQAKIYADSLWEATKDADDPLLRYHSFDEIRQELYGYQANYPTLCRVDSIGASYQGRGLFFIKISDNVNLEEAEPELKYISTMHGDEPPGTEMCLCLIDTLMRDRDSHARNSDSGGFLGSIPTLSELDPFFVHCNSQYLSSSTSPSAILSVRLTDFAVAEH